MLQFLLKERNTIDPAKVGKQVIEGGCRWIEIDMPEAPDNIVKDIATTLIDTCKEKDVFLVIRDHIEVVDELKVSGIHITDPQAISKTRERLGANAVVGVSVKTLEDVISLRAKDADYVTVKHLTPTELKIFVEEVRNSIMKAMPIVAEGSISLENIEEYLATGINGIAVSYAVDSKENPEQSTRLIMEKLLQHK